MVLLSYNRPATPLDMQEVDRVVAESSYLSVYLKDGTHLVGCGVKFD